MSDLIGKIILAKSPEHFNKIDSYITLKDSILISYQIVIKGPFRCKDGRVIGEKGKYVLALLASSYNREDFNKLIAEQLIDAESMVWYDDILEEDLRHNTPYGPRIKNSRYYAWPSDNFNKMRERIGYASDANLITEDEWNKHLKSLPGSKKTK